MNTRVLVAILGAGLLAGLVVLAGLWFFRELDRQKDFAACIRAQDWQDVRRGALGNPFVCQRFARTEADDREMLEVSTRNLKNRADDLERMAKGR